MGKNTMETVAQFAGGVLAGGLAFYGLSGSDDTSAQQSQNADHSAGPPNPNVSSAKQKRENERMAVLKMQREQRQQAKTTPPKAEQTSLAPSWASSHEPQVKVVKSRTGDRTWEIEDESRLVHLQYHQRPVEKELPSWASTMEPQVDASEQSDKKTWMACTEESESTSTSCSSQYGWCDDEVNDAMRNMSMSSPGQRIVVNAFHSIEDNSSDTMSEYQQYQQYLPSWASTKDPCTPVPVRAPVRGFTPSPGRGPSTPTSISHLQNDRFAQSVTQHHAPALTPMTGSPKTVSSARKVVGDVAFALSDAVFVYPVVNNNFLGQELEARAHAQERNASGHRVQVRVMQTRSGAGDAVVGALSAGMPTTVLAASESLRPMLPSLFQMAQQRLPAVLHVAAFSVDKHLALGSSVEDVMCIRDVGLALLSSSSAQEAHDMALVAHLAAHASSTPFLHFFDGVRTLNQETTVLRGVSSVELANSAKAIRESTESTSPTAVAGLAHAAPADCPLVASQVESIFAKLEPTFGRRYRLVEYVGSAHAEAVVVAMGASAAVVASAVEMLGAGARVGVLAVRLLRPLSSAHLLAAVPRSARRVCVLDQSGDLRPLFQDVAAAFHSSPAWVTPLLVGGRIVTGPGADEFTPAHALAVLHNLNAQSPSPNFTVCERGSIVGLSMAGVHKSNLSVVANGSQQVVIFTEESSNAAPSAIAELLGSKVGLHVQRTSQRDSMLGANGVSRHELRIASSPDALSTEYTVTAADVIVCDLPALLSKHDVLASAKDRSSLVVVLTAGSTAEDGPADSAIPSSVRAAASRKNMSVSVVDARGCAAANVPASWLAALAAVRVANESIAFQLVALLQHAMRAELVASASHKAEEIDHAISMLTRLADFTRPVSTYSPGSHFGFSYSSPAGGDQSGNSSGDDGEVAEFVARAVVAKPGQPAPSSAVTVAAAPTDAVSECRMLQKHEVAWRMMFKSAYETRPALRPSEHGVHHVRLTSRKRLTPDEYDRNVFHLEFDISGTGLKYQIGDALGVYGHNNAQEVDEFLDTMGWDGEQYMAMPSRGEMPARTSEVVTLRKLLQQYLDIFGRPSKKFYVALAQHATSRYEYLRLMHIGTDDAEAFKLGIHETVTFAELMVQFKSARPSPAEFVAMVPAIKPRHYSIASSNNLNPHSVHLLVVAVDWVTPLGKKRYGQCTRYLAELDPNDHENNMVTVDIMPSVLRLPPTPQQPIVMAGLGTGMAPFRAFIQERKFQKESGIDVGPVVLYFGARHRAQEYLYGEELDEFFEEGLVTRLGLAFSRDQKQKVYIQHKIEEDGALLKELLEDKQGSFYLCGPTWPVPDVRDAIAKGMQPGQDPNAIINTESVEKLKAEGRYVLEVY